VIAPSRFGGSRARERTLGIDDAERVEHRVESGDPCKDGLRRLDRGGLRGSKEAQELGGGAIGEIVR